MTINLKNKKKSLNRNKKEIKRNNLSKFKKNPSHSLNLQKEKRRRKIKSINSNRYNSKQAMRFKNQIIFKVNKKRIKRSFKVCLNNNLNKITLFILIIWLSNLNLFKIKSDKARNKNYNNNKSQLKQYPWMIYLTK